MFSFSMKDACFQIPIDSESVPCLRIVLNGEVCFKWGGIPVHGNVFLVFL